MNYNNIINRIKEINPNIKFVGEFDNYNQKIGYWEFYNRNGNLLLKGNYLNGLKDGYWDEYYANGQIELKGTYINGIFHEIK